MNQNQYHGYSAPWNGGHGQPYPSSGYSPTSYQHGTHDIDMPPHQPSVYGGMGESPSDIPYPGDYYTTTPSFSQSSAAVYPSTSQGMSPGRDPQSSQRSGHYYSGSQAHIHGHPPYIQAPSHSQSHYMATRPSSHSQAPSYARTQTLPIAIPQQSPSHYHSPPQAISISPQYPASPTRPFTCDLCSLSFNRQHDLKRHRETHTGDKPYHCNGGCGKTFTRKDALKRHQLVKGCGKVDEAWP